MKFRKFMLDESFDDFDSVALFSNDIDSSFEGSIDDNFSDGSDIPDVPQNGPDMGIADLIITSIKDEYETIKQYNSMIATLRYESDQNPEYAGFIEVLSDITNEENKHVGQLQRILKEISPNAKSIDIGERESESQFKFKNGLLQVQSWDEPTVKNNSSTPNQVDDMCSITDVDDEM